MEVLCQILPVYTKIGEKYSMKHSSLAAFYYYSGYGGKVVMGYVL